MDSYYSQIQPYKLLNLSRQLQTPTLVRVDINLPASGGRIEEDALRMRVYAHVLELYSDYAGLVVMRHQGIKGDDYFTSFRPHLRALRKVLAIWVMPAIIAASAISLSVAPNMRAASAWKNAQ